jgi:exoribonuclease-2
MIARIRASFDAVVTGASINGTWVRLIQPLTEGRLTLGFQGLDVGDPVHVKLIYTDVMRGFIDFARD